jgi:quercetin dioxygenase-like cupin family protein
MPHEKIPAFARSLPEIQLPFDGARGWLVQGQGQQVVFVEFDRTVEVPEHTHEDQWEFALAGRVELHRGGETQMYERGDNFFVPAGEPHAATVHAGYRAMIVFDAPARYLPRS